MPAHLEDAREADAGNQRNGHNHKRALTEGGGMEVVAPRDVAESSRQSNRHAQAKGD